ncbi:uncharacterized protein CTRU02_215496 [Colletotrichum truncatum]|uniref:Uncharacterized protein n=1 Tax=Colletotrichum truncatum TaxID=5467 RepID=A0ACC3YCR1_COLTU|nr:uncharacterized protein CTRU02_05560 [Colletotrichum truncatum]KAF6794003.1 hypothetical protein CTRU02_05560 [Colletotrichum truncatum]
MTTRTTTRRNDEGQQTQQRQPDTTSRLHTNLSTTFNSLWSSSPASPPLPMLEDSTIRNWLSTLSPTSDPDEEKSLKRKRSFESFSPHRLPSPPSSLPHPDQDAMNPHEAGTTPATPLRKNAPRLLPNEDATEVDLETPRGPRVDPSQAAQQTAQSDASSIASSISEQTSMSEQTSAASKKRKRPVSPRKQSNLIAIQNSMYYRSFDGEVAPPPALDRLLIGIESLGNGIGIVSPTQEESVRANALTNRQFRWVRDETFAPNRDELGPTPSVKSVRKIWSAAFGAETAGHEEGQWTLAVHGPLLGSALEEFERIGWCSCTTAQILPKYTRSDKSAHHNKKVDLCVYVSEQSDEVDAAILASQTASINQTDHPSLIRTPIGLSIETKITGHDWVNAVNQITVWLIAQWDSLDDFVSSGQRVRPGYTPAAAAGLTFLPGIIVQGHEWWFVAVVRKPDGATEFWSKKLIGSTTTTEGIYQVVAVLQLLGRWIETEYWPWFQAAILKKA